MPKRPSKAEPAPLSKEGTERLSIFEDFLEKLDFDKPDDKDKPMTKTHPPRINRKSQRRNDRLPAS